MFFSLLRFWYKGWIYDLYVKPDFFFTYYGFDWVKTLGEPGMYYLFGLMLVCTIGIVLGLFYRTSIILFFLSFTYVELIDKTNYLNHYYFVSLISFLLCFLPANKYCSLDVLIKPSIKQETVSAWCINIIKFQLFCVYFFAGIAKINPDWMLHALPLKIWLPAKSELPLIGGMLKEKWLAYLFSWAGCLYDLFIVFFLLYKPTRILAYSAVIVFHIMTAILFPIGVFPYIMIFSTLIFFSEEFHKKLLSCLGVKNTLFQKVDSERNKIGFKNLKVTLITVWILLHLFLPFRYLLYEGNLFWHEQGYRFSWRVMLMEKAGYANFYITDPHTKRFVIADNNAYLSPNQIKMMSTQPDMILQFAHFLGEKYQEKGIRNPEVTAEVYVTLNGEPSRLFIDKNIDLSKEKRGFHKKKWIIPYQK